METKKKQDKQIKFNLRPILEKRGWTIQDFSDNVGLGYRAAHGIVTNRYKRLGLDTLSKICNALDLEITDVLVWE